MSNFFPPINKNPSSGNLGGGGGSNPFSVDGNTMASASQSELSSLKSQNSSLQLKLRNMQQELLNQDTQIKRLKKVAQKKKGGKRKKASTHLSQEQLKMIQEYEDKITKLQQELKHKSVLLENSKQLSEERDKETLDSRIPSWIIEKSNEFKQFIDLNWECIARDDLLILFRKLLTNAGKGSSKSNSKHNGDSASSSYPRSIFSISGVGKKSLLYSIMHDTALRTHFHQQIIFNPFQSSLSQAMKNHSHFRSAMVSVFETLSSLEYPTLILIQCPDKVDLAHFLILNELDWSVVCPGTCFLLSVEDDLANDISSHCSFVQHVHLTPMSKLKALRLLDTFIPIHKENETVATELIQKVHGNPFHLSLAAAMLRALPENTPTLTEPNVWKTVLAIWSAQSSTNSLKSVIYELERTLKHDFLFEAMIRCAVFPKNEFPLSMYALCLNSSLQYAYSIVEQLRLRRLMQYFNGKITIPSVIHRILKEIVTDDHDFGDFSTHHRRFCMILAQCCASNSSQTSAAPSPNPMLELQRPSRISNESYTFEHIASLIYQNDYTHDQSVDELLTNIEWTSFISPYSLSHFQSLSCSSNQRELENQYEIFDPKQHLHDTQKYFYRHLCQHLHEATLPRTRTKLIQSSLWFHNKVSLFPQKWRDLCLQDFMGEEPALFSQMVALLSDTEIESNLTAQPARLISTQVRKYFHDETGVIFMGDDFEGETVDNTVVYYPSGARAESGRYCTMSLVEEAKKMEDTYPVSSAESLQTDANQDTKIDDPAANGATTSPSAAHLGNGLHPVSSSASLQEQQIEALNRSTNYTSQITCLTTLAGSILLAATRGGHVIKFHIGSSKNNKSEMITHFDNPVSSMLTHKLTILVTGHNDGSVRIFSLEKKELDEKFMSHKSAVTALAITNDGGYVISASEDDDYAIRMYDLNMGLEVKHFKGCDSNITGLYIDRRDKFFYASSLDGSIRYFLLGQTYKKNVEKSDGIIEPDIHIPRGACNRLIHLSGMEHGGNYLIAAYDNGFLVLFDLFGKQQVDWIRRHDSAISFMEITGDQQYVVSSDYTGKLQFTKIRWEKDAEKNAYTPRFRHGYALKCVDGGPVSALTTSSNGALFVIGSHYEQQFDFPIMHLQSHTKEDEWHPADVLKTAFIIGNGTYLDEKFENCPKASSDAKGMKKACIRDLGISPEYLMCHSDITAEKLLVAWKEYRQMQQKIRKKFSNCRIVSHVYYSGHVDSWSVEGKNFLLPVDFPHFGSLSARVENRNSRRVHLEAFGINLEELLHRDGADSVVLIVDGSKDAHKARMHPVDICPTRSHLVAQSYDSTTEEQHSVFTYYLLRHLRKERHISLGTILNRVKDELYLDEETDQMPAPFRYSDDWVYNYVPNSG